MKPEALPGARSYLEKHRCFPIEDRAHGLPSMVAFKWADGCVDVFVYWRCRCGRVIRVVGSPT